MSKYNRRFTVIYKEGSELIGGTKKILVDKETGVNYLVWKSSYGAAITPLLDSNGNPVVTKL